MEGGRVDGEEELMNKVQGIASELVRR
jgi:hypothetical protein